MYISHIHIYIYIYIYILYNYQCKFTQSSENIQKKISKGLQKVFKRRSKGLQNNQGGLTSGLTKVFFVLACFLARSGGARAPKRPPEWSPKTLKNAKSLEKVGGKVRPRNQA
jgi:hypothetical protein